VIQKIFVGNLPPETTRDDIRELFDSWGEVTSVGLPGSSGRPRNFAFVEMPVEDAREAIKALNGTELNGCALNVNAAQPLGAGGRG
jgi:RNA recognition motif-containing protein